MNKGRRVAGMLLLVCSLQAAIAQTKPANDGRDSTVLVS